MKTDRLILRPWRDSDASALHELLNGTDSLPSGWTVSRSVGHSLGLMTAHLQKELCWAVVDSEQNIVGWIELSMPDAEISFWISDAFKECSYETEVLEAVVNYACREGGLSQVWSSCAPGDTDKIEICSNSGFKLHHWRKGRNVSMEDEKTYLMYRHEFIRGFR